MKACGAKGGGGVLDHFFPSTVHINYICKTQYIAQNGNLFIQTVVQFVIVPSHTATRTHDGDDDRALGHVVVGLHSVTGHFRPCGRRPFPFCTLYKYVIVHGNCILLEPFVLYSLYLDS